ncbi:MAG TPA: sialate O-acetylesterase [Lachnoclostridium phytofermentans]|uniref:Sialate O-acetylesterase n=1 Tax=Lachnoclostridium phytofermentans TaxID=66219 RepID=A0A3D2X7B3_9FIRM|nr:sialate O-acetylesterase [Lachnoclostridium sp.]HCL03019.1 sialate O-acetylesterase [Lachnoclostridium phytofermentans]
MKLSPLFSNGMVLLREKEQKLFGQTAPNSNVTINFLSQTYHTFSDTSGNFTITLPKMSAGGPYEMSIIGDEIITIQDIYFGDVYLLSGQSNMVLPISRTLNKNKINWQANSLIRSNNADEIHRVNEKFIRYFTVPKQYQFDAPADDLEEGIWLSVTPETILPMSAVGYYFAKEIHDRYDIPIGLIEAAVGGAPIEAFISEETLRQFGRYDSIIKQNKQKEYVDSVINADNDRMQHWYQALDNIDLGLKQQEWYQPEYQEEGFTSRVVPELFRDNTIGAIRGSFWFRKTFTMEEDYLGEDAILYLGSIIDSDQAYLNGKLIGRTEYQYPPRCYPIPAGLLKNGVNALVVRVISSTHDGGFVPDKPYGIRYGSKFIDLSGNWQFRIGATCETLQSQSFFNYMPTSLYQGMIYPLRNYAIKGVLFYQGESNDSHPEWYEELFRAMIKDWRTLFDNQSLPFLYVQLANFGDHKRFNTGTNWAYLREAQRHILNVPNTAMAVTLDIGEYNDLHPQNKQAVGKRLALAARAILYEEDITYQGPIISDYNFILIEDRPYLELIFSSAENGLLIMGDQIQTLELSTDGLTWEVAKASINDSKLLIPVTTKWPQFVRYAFANNPEGANLYNTEGLPASSFLLSLQATS